MKLKICLAAVAATAGFFCEGAETLVPGFDPASRETQIIAASKMYFAPHPQLKFFETIRKCLGLSPRY